ncbi:hypothetical protein FACHB389_19985 [Nostoc calcicola FACHB-389]|nr:hypothetical protein FACHB389_19985 [Nostoc calcicola FACHB-389]
MGRWGDGEMGRCGSRGRCGRRGKYKFSFSPHSPHSPHSQCPHLPTFPSPYPPILLPLPHSPFPIPLYF